MTYNQLPTNQNTSIPLPESYEWAQTEDIQPEEVIKLRESVGWDGDSIETWQKCLKDSVHVSAVRDDKGELVGIGFLSGNARHAVLADFDVNPNNQKEGIGRALVSDMLKVADDLEIKYLYTSLANPELYAEALGELGFVSKEGNLFRAKQY